MWVQFLQWEADSSKCAVDVPDSSCDWYIASPNNKQPLEWVLIGKLLLGLMLTVYEMSQELKKKQ